MNQVDPSQYVKAPDGMSPIEVILAFCRCSRPVRLWPRKPIEGEIKDKVEKQNQRVIGGEIGPQFERVAGCCLHIDFRKWPWVDVSAFKRYCRRDFSTGEVEEECMDKSISLDSWQQRTLRALEEMRKKT